MAQALCSLAYVSIYEMVNGFQSPVGLRLFVWVPEPRMGPGV